MSVHNGRSRSTLGLRVSILISSSRKVIKSSRFIGVRLTGAASAYLSFINGSVCSSQFWLMIHSIFRFIPLTSFSLASVWCLCYSLPEPSGVTARTTLQRCCQQLLLCGSPSALPARSGHIRMTGKAVQQFPLPLRPAPVSCRTSRGPP